MVRILRHTVGIDEDGPGGSAVGYSDKLLHGVTGQGLNDYDAIFGILSGVGFSGWTSAEDGMNGLEEIRDSVEFLEKMRARYYG